MGPREGGGRGEPIFCILKEAFNFAISFVKMKSEVPSLPNCYSFILPTLSQEPGSPSATSEAEEQPGKAQRVQEPRGMMETGQPDQRVGA